MEMKEINNYRIISDDAIRNTLPKLRANEYEKFRNKIRAVIDYMKENYNLTEEEENAFIVRIYNRLLQKNFSNSYANTELTNIQMLSEIFDNVGIPGNFKRSLLIGYLSENFSSTKYIKDALFIIPSLMEQGVSLMISGPPGVGKTLLASHLSWAYLIITDYKDTKSTRFYSYYNLGNDFLNKKFIVVDDFNLLSKNKVRDLIYKIYDNNILAILTTNLSDAEFLSMFKDEKRVLRRIGEKFRWLFLFH
jgi:DNA replication protein DnaC